MQPVLRRIAIHGGLTAVLLALVGLMMAELAGMWLTASPGTRAANGAEVVANDANGEMTAALRKRMPMSMALWGFVFVALGEMTLHLVRGRKPVPLPPQPEQHSDEAEKLLLELLAKAESASRQETGDGSQGSDNKEQEPAATPAAEATGSPPAAAS
jgi:hypothetical protein